MKQLKNNALRIALTVSIGLPGHAYAQDQEHIFGAARSHSASHLELATPAQTVTLLADRQAGHLLEKWGPSKRELEALRLRDLQLQAEAEAIAAERAESQASQFLAAPLMLGPVSSGFGLRRHPISGELQPHLGVDLAAPSGTPIIAPKGGVVSRAGWSQGYGLFVALDHDSGLETRFAHLSHIEVAPGDRVHAGQIIGLVGSTGRSTGAHLHYEVRMAGRPIDPLSLGHGMASGGFRQLAK